MSGVKDKVSKVWDQLVKVAKEQGDLLEAMREVTEKALEAARENDTDKLQEALVGREELMQQVESLQDKEREIRSKVAGLPPVQVAEKLGAVKDYQFDLLEKVVELNGQLEKELAGLKQRLANDMEQVIKLKQTAQGYRPKDLSQEGHFVDLKR